MSSINARKIAVLIALSALIAPRLLHAQRRSDLQKIETKGQIEAVRPGFIKATAGGGTWVLKVQAKPADITLEGTAGVDWLKPGMLVRFVAPLNDQGVAQAPIEELTVFTPRPGYGVGVMPESRLGADVGLDADTPPAGPAYLVAGQLASINDRQLIVSAGRDRVAATLADEIKIHVDMLGDYSLARPGDEIDFSGWAVQPGQAIVHKIKIVAANPFEAPLNRQQPTKEKRRRGRKGAAPPVDDVDGKGVADAAADEEH